MKVPKENLIGEENKGWTYAKYLLEFERGNPYSAGLNRSLSKVRELARSVAADGETLADDPHFQRKANDLERQIMAMEATELRIFSEISAGQNIGPGSSSLLKTRGTEIQQDVSELAVEAIGQYGFPFVSDTQSSANTPDVGLDGAPIVVPSYFNKRKTTIYAGSNEIQRNIIAKAVLGL